MSNFVPQDDHAASPTDDLLRFHRVDAIIILVCCALGSLLAWLWIRNQLTWASSDATEFARVAIRPVTFVVFASTVSLFAVLLSQFFSGRKSLSFGEFLGVAPLLLFGVVACLPDIGTFSLWVLATLFCGLCGLVHLAVRLLQPQYVARQWTNWFGSLTCFLTAVWVWLSLTMQPVVI